MTSLGVHELIQRYEAQTGALAGLVARVTPEMLDRAAASKPGTIRRWVHHLADTAIVGAFRARSVAAADGIALPACDFARWTEALAYDVRPLDASLAVFHSVRRATTELLRALPPDAWTHAGHHDREGPLSLHDLLALQCDDADEHLDDIRAELQRAG